MPADAPLLRVRANVNSERLSPRSRVVCHVNHDPLETRNANRNDEAKPAVGWELNGLWKCRLNRYKRLCRSHLRSPGAVHDNSRHTPPAAFTTPRAPATATKSARPTGAERTADRPTHTASVGHNRNEVVLNLRRDPVVSFLHE